MADTGGRKKKVRRENTMVVPMSLRQRLIAWMDQNRPLNKIAEQLGTSEKWLWNLRNHDSPVDRNLVRFLCQLANIPFGPLPSAFDDFTWVPAEEEHVRWVASQTPTVYEETVSVETKLNWLQWHQKGYWAILHQGLVCGICECLSLDADVMQRLCRGEVFESQLVSREFFAAPIWPAKHLLIQHLMILDRETKCIEASPLAFTSILVNMPTIIERCVDYEIREATVYASPMHSQEQNRKLPSISERLLLKLGFTAVPCDTKPPFPFFSIKAAALVERLKQLREAVRLQ